MNLEIQEDISQKYLMKIFLIKNLKKILNVNKLILFFQKKNSLRGIHFQKKPFSQKKILRVIKGKIFDVVVDIRKKSKSFGKFKSVILSEKNKKQIYIPDGFAHGYMTLSRNAKVEYICSNFYNKNYDVAIKWNDKKININWPKASKYLISKKDKNGINL